MLRCLYCLLLLTFSAAAQNPAQAVASTLDDWHHAAAVADEARYFGYFTTNAVFMGTDAAERWTVPDFRQWAKPQFQRKSAWSLKPRDRHIEFSADANIAWFDEMLDTPNLGVCRGSGVLVRSRDKWKIAQYNLSIPIPNGLAASVVKQIQAQDTAHPKHD
jgi:hypothetical protein